MSVEQVTSAPQFGGRNDEDLKEQHQMLQLETITQYFIIAEHFRANEYFDKRQF